MGIDKINTHFYILNKEKCVAYVNKPANHRCIEKKYLGA